MKKALCHLNLSFVAAALLSGMSFAAHAAEEGNWMVRVRAVQIKPANQSEIGSGAATGALPADALQVSTEVVPELDVTYFFTKHIAAELLLGLPVKHDVTIAAGPFAGPIGSFKHLPPTLTLQYHFMPDAQFRPYLGVGINYTRVTSVGLTIPPGPLDLERSSVGAALQAGFDVKVAPQMFFNVDIKKLYIDADVKFAGAKISNAKLDPIVFGVGLGWRFN